VIVLLGFIGLVELLSFLTIGQAQGKRFVLFHYNIDVHGVGPWLVSFVFLVGGGIWLRREARAFKAVWDGLIEIAHTGNAPPGNEA
jgi:branched-chain amino acid transport system permease protein